MRVNAYLIASAPELLDSVCEVGMMNEPKLVILVCRDCGVDHDGTIYWAVREGDRCMFKCPVCHQATPHVVSRVGAIR
jgi:hypothetical protein